MPGVTATRRCRPRAPTTVTELMPDAVVTIAATGTVSTGPSDCPVSTVTRTFSPFSAAARGADGRTASGMNSVAPEPPEPVPAELADPDAAAAGAAPLPMSTTVPDGATVVAVPRPATVPVA